MSMNISNGAQFVQPLGTTLMFVSPNRLVSVVEHEYTENLKVVTYRKNDTFRLYTVDLVLRKPSGGLPKPPKKPIYTYIRSAPVRISYLHLPAWSMSY